MARPLETYTASGQIRSGPVAAVADVSAPSRALGRLGGALAGAGDSIEKIVQQRQVEKSTAWASDSYNNFQRELIDFHDANKDSEDYGTLVRDFGDKRIAEMAAKAPAGPAADHFKYKAIDTVNRHYSSALQIGERNRLENFSITQSNSTAASIDLYKATAQSDPESSLSLLGSDLNGRLADVDFSLGKSAPIEAQKIKTETIHNTVIGAMEIDPEGARRILDDHPELDANVRRGLLNQINNASQSRSMSAANTLHNQLKDNVANAKLTDTHVKIPTLQWLQAVVGTDQGQVLFDNITRETAIVNAVIDFNVASKGTNPSNVANESIKSWSKIGGEPGLAIRDHVTETAKKYQEQIKTDSAAWGRKNPMVESLYRAAENAPKNMKSMLTNRAQEMQIEFQGYPPAGTPPDLAKNYLYRDSHDVRLLTNDEATKWSSKMNSGKPSERIAALQEFTTTYGKHESQAWSDLTKLPEGQRPAGGMQLAVLNRFTQAGPMLVAALSNEKVLKELNDEGNKKDIEIAFGGTNFKAFAISYAGADFAQNSPVVLEFKHAVTAYALAIQEGTLNQRIKTAYDTLVETHFGVTDIRGQNIAIAKYRDEGKAYRSKGEIALIKSSVTDMMRDIDPSKLGTDNAMVFQQLPIEGQSKVMSNYLNSTMLVPSTDGQGLYLYFKREDKIPVQMRDRSNNPIFYSFDNPEKTNWPITPKGKELLRRKLEIDSTPAEIDSYKNLDEPFLR